MTLSKKEILSLKAILTKHSRDEKHIGYHILPERFNNPLAGTADENKYVFHERERFRFFSAHVDFTGKKVVDIGCNIGYFLFSILDAGASHVTGYEGKLSCGDFVKAAISAGRCQDSFTFFNTYYQFSTESDKFDVGLLLNVLHHLGDDYGSGQIEMGQAKEQMLLQLNRLSHQVSTLVFQMGFNWKGNRECCLFENGTKTELIDFIRSGTADHWDVDQVGIPERVNGLVTYQPLDERNIVRKNELGEFLNRPLFILKSKSASRASSAL